MLVIKFILFLNIESADLIKEDIVYKSRNNPSKSQTKINQHSGGSFTKQTPKTMAFGVDLGFSTLSGLF